MNVRPQGEMLHIYHQLGPGGRYFIGPMFNKPWVGDLAYAEAERLLPRLRDALRDDPVDDPCPNADGIPVCGPAGDCAHVEHGNGSRWG